MSEWKPGTVAMVTFGDESPVIAFRDADTGCLGWSVGERRRGSVWIDESKATAVRPLAVVDPEQAERLVNAYLDAYWSSPQIDSNMRRADEKAGPIHIAAMQAALREFAKPAEPKPERPTGLGAVVRDSTDVEFVHLGSDLWTYGTTDGPASSFTWDELDAVEVLSQGWSA